MSKDYILYYITNEHFVLLIEKELNINIHVNKITLQSGRIQYHPCATMDDETAALFILRYGDKIDLVPIDNYIVGYKDYIPNKNKKV